MMSGKEEEKDSSRWTYLADDVLEMIMQRLCLTDYLGLRAVCSPWRATITKAIANKYCHPLPELPLVLLISEWKSSEFFSLSTERVFCPKRPLLEINQMCHGTVEGWMIVSENVDVGSKAKAIYFLNPVTNARVLVPSLLNLPSNSPIPDKSELYMGKMVASSKPIYSDCVLVGLFTDYCHITFCRLSDKSWTMIEAEETGTHFLDVEILDGKLYVRSTTNRFLNSILVYDLQDSSDDPPKPKVLAMLPQIRPTPVSTTNGNQIHVLGNVIRFLAKDDASGELLLIYLFCNIVYEIEHVGYMNIVNQYVSPPKITKCEVFKLDTSNETNQWVKVDDLGDRVLFLSTCKGMVISNAALNSTEELITGNSIYFALYNPCPAEPWGIQLGMLCLTDNSIKYFSVEKSGLEDNTYPFWFLPSAWTTEVT